MNLDASLLYATTSIFSPFNSLIIFPILTPLSPIQDPIASTLEFSEYTAILVRFPASLAIL